MLLTHLQPAEHGAFPAPSSADVAMISGMRLLLAVTALLTLFVNPGDMGVPGHLTWSVMALYVVHSVVLFMLAHFNQPFSHGQLIYWLDVVWSFLIVLCTGGGDSYFFPFFFFAILTSSFQHGLALGARITLASSLLLAAGALTGGPVNLPFLLLRVTFVMALGYMIAYWGGLGLLQKRRLALLHDVSQQSNPRFGVDHTLDSILEKMRRFFQADSCILIMHDAGEQWLLRTATPGAAPRSTVMAAAAVAPLMAFDAGQSLLFAPSLRARLGLAARLQGVDRDGAHWQALDEQLGAGLAELLDGSSFISVPLPLRKGEGRIYLSATRHRYARADARFLLQIVAQVFPMIENIELVDRLASGAAYRERQKIARDLHDTTIQPYIGLRHGLSALRNSATADNPLVGELDKLIDMSGQVIGDLRQMAQSLRTGAAPEEAELLLALRRQAAQIQKFFGIEIEIAVDGVLALSDRLAAEVFQIVNEGMSNIRKHTTARSGRITLASRDRLLTIVMENERQPGTASFTPVSITERVMALGGKVEVGSSAAGVTTVSVAIPV